MQELIQYLKENRINYKEIDESLIKISGERYFLVKPDEDGLLFDDNFHLIDDEAEGEFDKYVFKFGGKWYWEDDPIKPKLNELKYIGEAELEFPAIPFLGVHGKYEILNGNRDYKDWCKKANFLGVNTLGICEKNTLAGTLAFQQACLGNGIKPIIGATYTVDRDDYRYDVKCYVKTKNGWDNLLKINKEVRIVNNGYIKEKDLFKFTGGIFLVFDPKSIDFDKLFPWDLHKEEIYYQFDCTEFDNNDRDKFVLENTKKFIDSKFKPVLISEAYYLDEEESYIKKKLNIISSKMEYSSSKQYFKCFDDILSEVEKLFPDTSKMVEKIEESVANLEYISGKCNFMIETGNRHLPVYKMTKEESKKYKNNNDLFWGLIEDGFYKFPEDKLDNYLGRIEKEYGVIMGGNVLDYFLILKDIINFCQRENILTGIGRGSAAGSLIAYTLDITKIDPIEYELLFERFLNEGRVKVSLPDIDMDFPAKERQKVKHYIENRYGFNYVCSAGTYTTLQLKALLKDLSRQENFSVGEMNYLTSILDLDKGNLVELFKNACKSKRLKKFVMQFPDIVNSINLLLDAPRAESVHPCAMIVTPKEKDIYGWFPVKWGEKDGERIIVSEWDGNELDMAGFLKEDILGIKQLDKISDIVNSIKNIEGESIDIYKIPYVDKKVYDYFKRGWNKDVFHFGSDGLIEFCKYLKPENIEDLIATNSLHRPGAMENNFHNEYVMRKHGEKDVEYYVGSEEILSKTYGVFVYQEQIMKMCQVLGGLNMVEADDVRKAMVKKKFEELTKYKHRFIPYYIKEFKVEEVYAKKVWDTIDKASTYLFNRSHATAYSMTGYICQWLKVHYPIYFWTTAFSYAKDTDIPGYISEIHKTGDIKVTPPDINISRDTFTTDFEKNSITWSLTSIKQVAEKSVEEILRKREEEGEIFSFEEFLSRHTFKGSKVNKSVIENLILSGCFDKVEAIKQPTERIRLIDFYREKAKVKVDKEKDKFHTDKDFLDENWWWILQQKLLSGFAIFPYQELIEKALDAKGYELIDIEDFFEEDSEGKKVKVGGYINEIKVRNSKKGEYAKMTIESNYEFINVTIWAEQWDVLKDVLEESEKKIILLSGRIQYDSYDKKNALVLSDDSEVLVLE